MMNPFARKSSENTKDEINADISEKKTEKKKIKKSLFRKSDNVSDDKKDTQDTGDGNADVSELFDDSEKKGLFGNHSKKKSKVLAYADYPHLQALRPQQAYIFKEDYFQYDANHFATILTLTHSDSAIDRFGPFWGLNLLPSNLPTTTTVLRLEQVHRMTDDWVASHQTRAENVANANINAQEQKGTNTTKRKASKAAEDLYNVAAELADGATYLNVHYRLLVISPSLEELDASTELIRKGYIDAFSSIDAQPYHGEQKQELANLFRRNEAKKGKGFYYTSTEYAGSYSLVTHGIEDPTGEFIGFMKGDVNSSAVLVDLDNYKRNIVIADEVFDDNYGERIRRSNLWGSKIAQSALLNNHRVVHFLISPVNLDAISPKFRDFTNVVRMNQGTLNPFEIFGNRKQQLTLFPKQLSKLRVMTELLGKPTDNDRTIIRGSLEQILTQFYIDSRMWFEDAQNHQDRLRIVGVPHNEIPKLSFFVAQLEQKMQELTAHNADADTIHAYKVLHMLYSSMLTNNGDLFNTTTSRIFDTANKSRRVVYDFSDLLLRSSEIAMAQMINVISYALSGLDDGDVAIFHGADQISNPDVQEFLNREFEFLYQRGGRVCLLYDNIHKYMQNLDFNEAIRANYTITSVMAPADADEYEQVFGVALPGPLRNLLVQTHGTHNYFHRNMDNIIFQPDIKLGVKPVGKRV